MSKSVVIGVVVVAVVVVVGGGILLAKDSSGNKKTDDTSNMNTTSNSDSSNTNTSTSTSASSTNSVTIQNFAFSPANITVKKGTTVTWTNQDSTAHTVTETDGQTGPNSDSIDPGKTFTFTYNTAGTFKYHCSIHSEMTGSVTVTE